MFDVWEEKLKVQDSINNPKIPLAYIEKHGILIYQEGDEFPVDPMTVIDTKPYVPIQQEYFAKIQREKEAKKLIKQRK